MKLSMVVLASISVLSVCACGNGFAQTRAALAAPATLDPDEGGAAAYCRQTHGVVETRRAVYGSNGPTLLFLAGVRTFCQYTKKKDGSRIHILLSTLYSTKPTLAALATF